MIFFSADDIIEPRAIKAQYLTSLE